MYICLFENTPVFPCEFSTYLHPQVWLYRAAARQRLGCPRAKPGSDQGLGLGLAEHHRLGGCVCVCTCAGEESLCWMQDSDETHRSLLNPICLQATLLFSLAMQAGVRDTGSLMVPYSRPDGRPSGQAFSVNGFSLLTPHDP